MIQAIGLDLYRTGIDQVKDFFRGKGLSFPNSFNRHIPRNGRNVCIPFYKIESVLRCRRKRCAFPVHDGLHQKFGILRGASKEVKGDCMELFPCCRNGHIARYRGKIRVPSVKNITLTRDFGRYCPLTVHDLLCQKCFIDRLSAVKHKGHGMYLFPNRAYRHFLRGGRKVLIPADENVALFFKHRCHDGRIFFIFL